MTMRSLLHNRVTYIWLLLAGLTVLTWGLGDNYEPGTPTGHSTLTVALLALAFFKVRLVLMYFMELLDAPWKLRLIFEAWVILVFGIVIAIYLTDGAFLNLNRE